MTHDDDLGPMPDAKIEPGEPNPGGVDAIDGGDEPGEAGQAGGDIGGTDPEPTTPDLPTDKNPAVDDAAPDELSEGEDTSTRATEGEEPDEAPASGEEESPA
jgi:hypothetical protein